MFFVVCNFEESGKCKSIFGTDGERDYRNKKMNKLEDGFMGVDLLKHNQEAFQEINKMIESGIKKIVAPRATGSGKTYLMGALAEQYNNGKKLVLEPTRPLLNSIEEKFDEFGIANTDFITYQKLIRMSDEDIAAMDYKLIFLDECHHGVAPVWGQKINCLINTHSDSIVFGTSATTVRNDGVNVVETLFDNNAIGELPLSTAIARKVLPCPHYIAAIYRLDDEFEKLKKKVEGSTNTKTEKKEFYKKMKEMKLHFEKSYGVPLILNKYIKVQNGRYLVFCKDKKHLDAMRDVVIDWFHTAGLKDVHSYAVYSDYPDKEKDYKEFCEDNSDSAKILFSINMLNEGLHIQDISGVLMLRTTQSNLIYLQQLGRLVEAENLDKYLVVFDFVNNFSSVNDGIGLLKEIKEAIAKEKESDPDFDDSGFEDIDTYFVIDQVLEVQEMFREIEGRLKGSFEQNVNDIIKYFDSHGYLPKMNSTDQYTRKLAGFLIKERINRREAESKSVDYPAYRINKLEAIPGFSWNPRKEVFNRFLYFLKEYKKNSNVYEIENNEVFMNYPIGKQYSNYCYKYKHNLLDDNDRQRFENLVGEVKNRYEIRYENNYLIAQECIKQGIIITKKNPCFKDVNLYEWVRGTLRSRCDNNKMTDDERKIIKQLIGFDIEEFGKRGRKPILIKVVYNNGDMGDETYSSIKEAASSLSEKLNVTISPCVVGRCLRGTRKNELYGFHFEYVNG